MQRLGRRVGALVAAAGTLVACSSGPQLGISVPAGAIRVGQCVVPPKVPSAELTQVEVVPCTQRHTQESYALVTYSSSAAGSSDTYPGAEPLKKFADGACAQRFTEYVGVAYADSSLFFTYLLPSARGWAAKDHVVNCFVTTTGISLTKSVKGSKL